MKVKNLVLAIVAALSMTLLSSAAQAADYDHVVAKRVRENVASRDLVGLSSMVLIHDPSLGKLVAAVPPLPSAGRLVRRVTNLEMIRMATFSTQARNSVALKFARQSNRRVGRVRQ